jgi:hypothetical protein
MARLLAARAAIVVASVAVLVVLAAPAALACSTHGLIHAATLDSLGPGRFLVRLSGLRTFPYEARHRCACGLAAGDLVTVVRTVRVVRSGINEPLASFGEFPASEPVTALFEASRARVDAIRMAAVTAGGLAVLLVSLGAAGVLALRGRRLGRPLAISAR